MTFFICSMKKYFTLLSFVLSSSFAFAQVADGFYRVKNADTQRYIYVVDNKGEANQNKIDVDATYLKKGLDAAICDPASIIYVEKHGSSYDFLSQGTGVHAIINHYLQITARSGHYSVGASISGVSAYLSDTNKDSSDKYGHISTDSKGYRLWDPIEVNSDSENYFGVKPDINSDGKYYKSFFASFGFSPVSENTKVYYVSKMTDEAVLLSEISDKVDASTPVIISCTSDNPSDNRLDLYKKGTAVSGNLLKGNYFDTDSKSLATFGHYDYRHQNQTKVQPNMRVLSVNASGKLVFAKCTSTNLPANCAYLVSETAKSELAVCFTKEEFAAYDPSSLSSIESDSDNTEVYNLLGKSVVNNGKLPAGIYIIGGKKTIIR